MYLNRNLHLLYCGNFFKYYSVFWVNGVYKCNKLSVHFKLTLDMVFVVLYRYFSCAADKTIDTGYTASTDCNY